MPLRPPGPRPVYNQAPVRQGGNPMQPPRQAAPMGMNQTRSPGGGPRMMMNQNGGGGMQMGGGGKMPPGGGQIRDFRMHPYGSGPSGPRNNAPINPY